MPCRAKIRNYDFGTVRMHYTTHAVHDDVIGFSLTRSVLYLYTLTFTYIANYAIAEFAFK